MTPARGAALAGSLALLVLVGSGRPPAVAATDLDEAQAQLDGIAARIDAATAERNALDAQLGALLGRIAEEQRALGGARADLESTRRTIDGLVAGIGERQAALNRRAAEVYMAPPAGVLDAVLSASTFQDASDALLFITRTARDDADLISTLTNEQARLEGEQLKLRALEVRVSQVLAELERAAGDLGEQLAQQRALIEGLAQEKQAAESLLAQLTEEQREEIEDPGHPPDPEPSPPKPPDPGPEAVKVFIEQYFSPQGQETVDVAMCVAQAESGFDPHAENPYTGAAGVYQFIPSTWESLSEAAGWGGSSVFDAEANVAVAAWTVDTSGWGHWPVAESCGA
jgi:peptidoglycan hydrolase CwlO-like protein